MFKYCLALVAAALIAVPVQALYLEGGPIYVKTSCFTLKKGKHKFHYSMYDDGGYRVHAKVYIAPCGQAFTNRTKLFNQEISTSEPYQLEKDFRVTSNISRRYNFIVFATADWSIQKN